MVRNLVICGLAYDARGTGGTGSIPRPFLNSWQGRELIAALCAVFIRCIANGRYDMAIKKALQAAGGVGFVYPVCSAPAYVSGKAYTVGQNVSYKG